MTTENTIVLDVTLDDVTEVKATICNQQPFDPSTDPVFEVLGQNLEYVIEYNEITPETQALPRHGDVFVAQRICRTHHVSAELLDPGTLEVVFSITRSGAKAHVAQRKSA